MGFAGDRYRVMPRITSGSEIFGNPVTTQSSYFDAFILLGSIRNMSITLSVVSPCFNEAANVPILLAEITATLTNADISHEIVLINDGSTDNTREVFEAQARNYSAFVGLNLTRNFGKEAAMFAGLQHSQGDYVVIMDSDLQHPAYMLPKLLERALKGDVDQVIARRNRKGDAKIRTFLSRTYYRRVNALMDVKLEDGVGDFRLLSRRAVNAILSLPEKNRFSKGIFSWIGFRSDFLDYENEQRRDNSKSSWSTKSLFNYALDGIVSFNFRPLRLVIYIGLLAFVVALIYLLVLLVFWSIHGVYVPGYLTTIATIVGLSGAQLISIGVLGEYVGRIYLEVKNRPIYLLEEKITGEDD